MVLAIAKELSMRSGELKGDPIHSIYFGGGTPSLLEAKELKLLLEKLFDHYEVARDIEITLEANPDDLTADKLNAFKKAGINRLSIGIQTFDDTRLKLINRAHTSREAKECLALAKEAGFDNISADLIYALPPDEMKYWESDLDEMLSYDLAHISLYGLTIEEKTVFGNWVEKKKLTQISEETAASQYRMAVSKLTERGYEHYEVSNFAKPSKESRHNSGYWAGEKYLGIGPGAHSYNGKKRASNVSNNAKYIASISESKIPQTIEELTNTNLINEYLFTHLRTRKGIDLKDISLVYGINLPSERAAEIKEFVDQKLMIATADRLSLTSEGLMLADEITMRLFYED